MFAKGNHNLGYAWHSHLKVTERWLLLPLWKQAGSLWLIKINKIATKDILDGGWWGEIRWNEEKLPMIKKELVVKRDQNLGGNKQRKGKWIQDRVLSLLQLYLNNIIKIYCNFCCSFCFTESVVVRFLPHKFYLLRSLLTRKYLNEQNLFVTLST